VRLSVTAEAGLRITCDREHKLAVVGALTAAGRDVLDLELHEPSLEDLFFGLSS
jgi:Cu-processing system ATP-binding protein